MTGRWFRFAVATLLGRRRGWFIPYRYAGDVDEATASYPAVAARFTAARPAFDQVLDWIGTYAVDLARIGGEPPPAPRWRQDWFPFLDAAAAYALVRALRPRRVVEIGSGHSTRFLARAVADGGLATRITAIDPAPRAPLGGLDIEHLARPLAEVGDRAVADLGPGDFLIVDSSHVLMPGSDVDLVINHLLPALPAGALVHFHDMLLPEPYPAAWRWRGYNEQAAVAALIATGAWRARWSSAVVRREWPRRVAALGLDALDHPARYRETSLWLEKP